jgi:pilus assembly protein Flp/PilA
MTIHELWLRAGARSQGSRRLWRAGRLERGASAVEYGLLIAGIAALIAVAVFAFGGGSTGMFQDSCKTIFADNSVGSCS